jgi:DNA replication protein DnaD
MKPKKARMYAVLTRWFGADFRTVRIVATQRGDRTWRNQMKTNSTHSSAKCFA